MYKIENGATIKAAEIYLVSSIYTSGITKSLVC